MAIDNYIPCHIISQNRKGVDKDKYALNDGLESGQNGESLPETTTPNGPLSCKAKSMRVAESGRSR